MPIKIYKCYINGQWIEKSSREKIDVDNPANGEVFASIYTSRIQETQHAL